MQAEEAKLCKAIQSLLPKLRALHDVWKKALLCLYYVRASNLIPCGFSAGLFRFRSPIFHTVLPPLRWPPWLDVARSQSAGHCASNEGRTTWDPRGHARYLIHSSWWWRVSVSRRMGAVIRNLDRRSDESLGLNPLFNFTESTCLYICVTTDKCIQIYQYWYLIYHGIGATVLHKVYLREKSALWIQKAEDL